MGDGGGDSSSTAATVSLGDWWRITRESTGGVGTMGRLGRGGGVQLRQVKEEQAASWVGNRAHETEWTRPAH